MVAHLSSLRACFSANIPKFGLKITATNTKIIFICVIRVDLIYCRASAIYPLPITKEFQHLFQIAFPGFPQTNTFIEKVLKQLKVTLCWPHPVAARLSAVRETEKRKGDLILGNQFINDAML